MLTLTNTAMSRHAGPGARASPRRRALDASDHARDPSEQLVGTVDGESEQVVRQRVFIGSHARVDRARRWRRLGDPARAVLGALRPIVDDAEIGPGWPAFLHQRIRAATREDLVVEDRDRVPVGWKRA